MTTAFRRSRIEEFDAVRGIALVFVFISHFSWTLDLHDDGAADLFRSVGMVATPMFLMLSGLTLGMLWCASDNRRDAIQSSLLNRGTILLGAHFVISAAAVVPGTHGYWDVAFGTTFATDAIAVAAILGPLMLRYLRIGAVPLVALTLFIGSWLVIFLAQPTHPVLQVLEEILFGASPATHRAMKMSAPIVPYFAFYAIGMWVGARWLFGRDGALLEPMDIGRRVGTAGLVCVLLAVVLNLTGELLASGELMMSADAYRALFSRYQKGPPGPAYALFYGGLAGCVCGAVFAFRKILRSLRLMQWFAVMGRASLPTFVIQFFVYTLIADLASMRILPLSLAYAVFGGSVLVLWLIAWLWDSHSLNRYLDLGMRVRYDSR